MKKPIHFPPTSLLPEIFPLQIKKIQATLIAVALSFSISATFGQAAITGTVKAGEMITGKYDNANHRSFATAVTLPVNTYAKGSIKTASDKDYYKFNVEKPGLITITLSDLPADYDIKLYNSLQKQIGVSENSGTKSETITYNATAGTFYVFVYGYNKSYNPSGNYTLNIQDDDGLKNAASVDNNIGIKIFPNPAQSVISISADKLSAESIIKVFDMQGKTVISKPVAAQSNDVDIRSLNPGSYFIQIQDADDNVSYCSNFVKE